MNIQSTPSAYSANAQAVLAVSTYHDSASRADVHAAKPARAGLEIPADRVELSAAARALASWLGVDASTPPGLSAVQIRELADRLRSGYYSQP